jgi:nucleotide-binding universal stress UspA family protein
MHFLLPTDGSDAALDAFKQAVALSRKMTESSRFTLLVVHDDAGLRLVKGFLPKGEVKAYLQEMADTEFAKSLKWAQKEGVDVKAVFKTGHVAETILATIDKLSPDMVVMGAKGRSGLVDVLMGSVAQRVAAKSTVPVLLVK